MYTFPYMPSKQMVQYGKTKVGHVQLRALWVARKWYWTK